MRTQFTRSKRLPILMTLLGVVACLPFISSARTVATSVTITNNSSLAIRHVYVSATNQDNWSADQLNGSIPPAGGSFTLDNVSCSGNGVKIIAEDQNGCFLYQVVACNESVTWTLTNESARDCGN